LKKIKCCSEKERSKLHYLFIFILSFYYSELHQHAKKMNNIAASNTAITEAKKITKMMQKNRTDRKKTKEFLTNEKNIIVNKDNQILLNKLVEISSGKWSSVQPAPAKAKRAKSSN